MSDPRVIAARVIPKKDTFANWAANNPIPIEGEECIEIGNPMQMKIGDGIQNYTSLPYLSGGGSSPSDGTLLGIADPTTNPGTPLADSFYFCQTPGNYIHFPISGSSTAVMPPNTTLGVLSFKTSSGFWTYRTLNSTSSSTTPTLQAVTAAGNLSLLEIVVYNSTNHTELFIDADKLTWNQGVGGTPWSLQEQISALNANRVQTKQNADGVQALVDPRVQTSATTTSPYAVNSDNIDWAILTALTIAITISNPTGTPKNRRVLVYSICDNGTARALTWDTKFFGGLTTPLPTTTSGSSKPLILEFIYCSEFSGGTPWHLVGINQE